MSATTSSAPVTAPHLVTLSPVSPKNDRDRSQKEPPQFSLQNVPSARYSGDDPTSGDDSETEQRTPRGERRRLRAPACRERAPSVAAARRACRRGAHGRALRAPPLWPARARAPLARRAARLLTSARSPLASGSRVSVSKSPRSYQPAKHKVRHRKQRQGQTIFKGHPSWKMMMNIKLGISVCVGREAASEPRELKLADFSQLTRLNFPPEGSANTPAHQSEVFSFDDHAPLAFRHLREHFGVSTEDYLLSICGAHAS